MHLETEMREIEQRIEQEAKVTFKIIRSSSKLTFTKLQLNSDISLKLLHVFKSTVLNLLCPVIRGYMSFRPLQFQPFTLQRSHFQPLANSTAANSNYLIKFRVIQFFKTFESI